MPSGDPIQVVWLKRDLRVHDHEPLVRAAALGPVVLLYAFEPEVLAGTESGRAHWAFVLESLSALQREVAAPGQPPDRAQGHHARSAGSARSGTAGARGQKQLLDQDPDGVFIRCWVPELAGVPTEHLPEPARMTCAEQQATGCRIGRDYPVPIVRDDDGTQRELQRRCSFDNKRSVSM